MYGLKQSARVWNQKVNKTLESIGFRQSTTDNCLYIKDDGKILTYVLVYVDDIIMASLNEETIEDVAKEIGKVVQINCLGDLNYYLGVQIHRDANGIFHINQKTYIEKLLIRFNMVDCKTSKIPMDPGYYKLDDSGEELEHNDVYRQAIGSLLFLVCNTRPDIAVAVSILGRKVTRPSQSDWTEVKRIFRYLKGTKDYRLKLGEADQQLDKPNLIAFTDADWGNDPIDRKSNSGYVFKLYGGTISWTSHKQNCVTLSSTEAEYIALSESCQEALWLENLFKDFQLSIGNIEINEDNQSCLKMLANEKCGKRTKHIEIKYHFAKNLWTTGKVHFKYCPTDENVADILTKPLAAIKFKKFVELIGLQN